MKTIILRPYQKKHFARRRTLSVDLREIVLENGEAFICFDEMYQIRGTHPYAYWFRGQINNRNLRLRLIIASDSCPEKMIPRDLSKFFGDYFFEHADSVYVRINGKDRKGNPIMQLVENTSTENYGGQK